MKEDKNKEQLDRAIWDALGQLPDPQPLSGYMSRFWTRLSQHPKPFLQPVIPRPWALATVGLSVLLIVGVSTGIDHYSTEKELSQMSADEVEMISNIDLAQYWQGIEHVNVLKDMDIIEHADMEMDEET